MNKIYQTLFSILAFGLLGGVIYLTLALLSPPAPQPINAPEMEFSAGRAMKELAVIASTPHPMGEFPAHAAVRDYLLDKVRALGLEPQVQDTFGIRLVRPGFILGGVVENILVRLPGTYPEGAILMIAHYDSTPGAPGAGDNGTGVVTLLEILRILHSSAPLRQDVIFLFVDGHEPGLIGSTAFIAQHPWFTDTKLVINLDIGRKGFPALVQVSQGNGLWIQALAKTTKKPTYISVPVRLFATGEQDLIPFKEAGIPGTYFGTSTATQEAHTMLDRPETVDAGSLQHIGDHILALVKYMGALPTLDFDSSALDQPPEQLYFPVLGRLVHYPIGWAWALAIVAGLCYVGTLTYGLRKKELTWKGLVSGLLSLLLILALGVGLTYLLWRGIQALHPDYQISSFRPHLSDDYLYAFGFFTIIFAVAVATIAVVRKKVTALDLVAGELIFWFIGTAGVTLFVPEMSYLGTWVLFFESLALLLALVLKSRKGSWIVSGLGFLLSAILATFMWLPIVNTAFQNPGLPTAWLMIGVAGLWIGAILPALDWITSPQRSLLSAAALVAGLALLLTGHFLVGKQSPPPLVNSVGYWLDANTEQAYWIAFIGGYRTDRRTTTSIETAFPQAMDERQKHLLVDPVRRPYTELFPGAPPFSILTSEAPMLAVGGPHLDILSDKWGMDRRVVKVKITASMHDRTYVIIPQESPLIAISVPPNDRIELPAIKDLGWVLRFDGTPSEGIEISFEFSQPGSIQVLVVEEKTGLPSFPGLSTQPEPGTMPSPGEFFQGIPSDFTAIYRSFEIPELGSE